jgi:DNA invertase Pin-like site-specific DNA recombinase
MTFSSNSAKSTPKTVAYLRVSTIDQDTDKNRAAILALANHKRLGHVEFVEEKVSGTVSWRNRKITAILEAAGRGGTIIVSELSRLGRSMLECMEILSIATQKGINIYAVKGDWQLTNSLQSKILAMAFSMASEIERDLISKRTREALLAKKQTGMRLGRPTGVGKSKLDAYRLEIEALLNNGSTQKLSQAATGRRRPTSTTSSSSAGLRNPGEFLLIPESAWHLPQSQSSRLKASV